MILPLGYISPDTGYQFPNFYGIGYGVGGRIAPRQPVVGALPPVRSEVRDMVSLSPAAQRILDQAERLNKMSTGEE
ncbi:MAG: hypothetical protein ACK502_06970 [Alphaproteobacteria bacterium]